MISSETVLDWQKDQYEHDMRNHFDILSLHKQDRIKHYAMHFAKYAGRLARGDLEPKSVERTWTDATLVCLSAANTLHQRLKYSQSVSNGDFFKRFTDAAGRFCDAGEKIDHVEEYICIARSSNADVFNCLMDHSISCGIDRIHLISERRKELRARQFFIR